MRNGVVIGACSALKKSYRKRLVDVVVEPILFVYLDGSEALIAKRMTEREGHFMPISLLQSQLTIVEPPGKDEIAVHIDISIGREEITASIIDQMKECST